MMEVCLMRYVFFSLYQISGRMSCKSAEMVYWGNVVVDAHHGN